MPVTTVVLLAVFIAILIEGVARRGARRGGWGWFLSWSLPGALAALATLSFAIGLLVLPLALVAVVLVSRFALWPELLGLFEGIAGVCLLVALVGSVDTERWVLYAGLFAVLGVTAYASARRHRVPRSG